MIQSLEIFSFESDNVSQNSLNSYSSSNSFPIGKKRDRLKGWKNKSTNSPTKKRNVQTKPSSKVEQNNEEDESITVILIMRVFHLLQLQLR